MKIAIIDTQDKQQKLLIWDSIDDFQKFTQSIEKVQRLAAEWPNSALEMEVPHLEVSITRQTSPKTVEQETFKKTE